jgi:protein-L-isoaspartate O-methyltransferase
VGPSGSVQDLVLLTKGGDGKVQQKRVLQVRFVPLVPGKK